MQMIDHHIRTRGLRDRKSATSNAESARLWVGAFPTQDMPNTRASRPSNRKRKNPIRDALIASVELTGHAFELVDNNSGYDPYDRGGNLR